ncbi:hypothetical protein GDO78_014160 [Eleutherodactylus coqui]|uniref:Uncharacterized protein n=1 Tax=Eleutherodactylus coqui TaxID=57060 RepID=A0A8J6EMI4_ELECQ|nr:hypothetical protein GDO78_014160 [Eleutherodactylus coqui]
MRQLEHPLRGNGDWYFTRKPTRAEGEIIVKTADSSVNIPTRRHRERKAGSERHRRTVGAAADDAAHAFHSDVHSPLFLHPSSHNGNEWSHG